MTRKLPSATGKQVARAAQQMGFGLRRQRGSHAIYIRPKDQARVVIPIHGGSVLKPKTLRGIIQDLKLTVEEFRKLLSPFSLLV